MLTNKDAETQAGGNTFALDFILTGVALSGTSGLLNAVNSYNEIVCADELMGRKIDLKTLEYPDSFMSTKRSAKLDAQRDLFAARPQPRRIGYRDSQAFRHLDKMLPAIQGKRLVLCVRGLADIAAVWDQKATDGTDAKWPAGRIGVYAIAESVVALSAALAFAPRSTLIVPHDAVAKDEEGTLDSVLEFLGVPDATEDAVIMAARKAERLAKQKERRLAKLQARKAGAEAAEEPAAPVLAKGVEKLGQRFLARVRASELDDLLQQKTPFRLSEVDAPLRGALRAIHPSMVKWLVRSVEDLADLSLMKAAADFEKRVTKAWRGSRRVYAPEETKRAPG